MTSRQQRRYVPGYRNIKCWSVFWHLVLNREKCQFSTADSEIDRHFVCQGFGDYRHAWHLSIWILSRDGHRCTDWTSHGNILPQGQEYYKEIPMPRNQSDDRAARTQLCTTASGAVPILDGTQAKQRRPKTKLQICKLSGRRANDHLEFASTCSTSGHSLKLRGGQFKLKFRTKTQDPTVWLQNRSPQNAVCYTSVKTFQRGLILCSNSVSLFGGMNRQGTSSPLHTQPLTMFIYMKVITLKTVLQKTQNFNFGEPSEAENSCWQHTHLEAGLTVATTPLPERTELK